MLQDLKIVVCDIDDTLVVKHQTLSNRARDVIQTLKEHGVLFGIASGRSYEQMKRMIHEWGYEELDFMICMNGSVLWDGLHQKKYDYFKLKKEWIKDIIELMSVFEPQPSIYLHDELYCLERDDMVQMSAKNAHMSVHVVEDLSEFYQEDNAKIMFRVNEGEMARVEAYIEQHASVDYHGFKTQPSLIEFADRRVSKAFALEKFCELRDIALSQVLAFGDTTNDNDMLMVSGVGVCMKNGSEDTKAIADIITELNCDEDGWAQHMECHVLTPRGWS